MQRPSRLLLIAAITTTAQAYTFTKLADTATPVPNGTGNFGTFGNMISADETGNVAFHDNNGTANKGIYLSSSATLTRVADLSTAIPEGSGNFTQFAIFGNGLEAGTLAFRGNGSSSQAGIYTYSSGTLAKIADTNTTIPNGTGTFTTFGTAYVDDTRFAFSGFGSSGQQGLYVSDGSSITRIGDKTSTVPSIGGTYGWSAQLSYDSGNLAFWSNITGGTAPGTIVGGYTSSGGLVTLATTATAAPGVGSNFTGFTSPVDLSGTTVAFHGLYSGGNGIFTANLSGGAITPIADVSTAVPEGSGTFTQLSLPNITEAGVVFHGTFSSGSGIYFFQNSALNKVIATTDTLDGKSISSLGISENSLADGLLAFRVNFTDSSVGIYQTLLAATPIARKPDALIRAGTTGASLGNGIYNTTGAGQSLTQTAAAGKTITFTISIQNDGTAADSFKVKATGSSANSYTIHYFKGKSDITSKVVAGTYTTASLPPGQSALITAKVKVNPTATTRSKATRLLTISSASSTDKKDAVKFTAKRSK